MNNEEQDNWKDGYFDSLRSEGTQITATGRVRWGGTGSVAVIYYLPDNRVLDFVTFSWRIVSDRPGLTAPTSFKVVPLCLLPHLERAQSSNREVFVDFWTDELGGVAEVITIATL